MDPAQWVDDLLAMQRGQTTQTWGSLALRGIDDTTPVVVDFHFWAPGPEEADALVGFLRRETPWEVSTVGFSSGLMGRREWEVAGRTQRRTVTLALLQEWARWMVIVGADHHCKFGQWDVAGPDPVQVTPAS